MDAERRGDLDYLPDCSLEEAAVYLGVSPTALARLVDGGRLPTRLGPDGRRRRVSVRDLDRHRDDRYALRQRLAGEARARRYPAPDGDAVGA